eukprot:scaffold707_cov240-Pinguiococcus_pyrenoidosus.AAC.13
MRRKRCRRARPAGASCESGYDELRLFCKSDLNSLRGLLTHANGKPSIGGAGKGGRKGEARISPPAEGGVILVSSSRLFTQRTQN